MGTVKVTIGVGDPQGRTFEDLEVIVDTGSTFTAVPRALLQRLEVPVERSLPSETADGRIVPVDVGETPIRLEGIQFHTPVIFAEGRTQPPRRGIPGTGGPGGRPLGGQAATGKPATPLTKSKQKNRPTPVPQPTAGANGPICPEMSAF